MTGPLDLTFTDGATALGRVRAALRRWCDDHGLGDEQWRRELLVVASELCTNAVEAAPASTPVRLHAWKDGGRVWLEVDDHGPGFELRPGAVPVPQELRTRGRGLLIVRSFTDHLEAGRGPEGSWVRVARRLDHDDGPPPTRGDGPTSSRRT
ncbi:MAG: ATP-binding protein [Acidimicrobiia bacterium]|nr:ATP-binding protein [Acidimicrobiia bacterium]